MTQRMMLERAAQAVGYDLPKEGDHDEIGRQYVDALGLWVKRPWGWGWFNPIGDGGHAFQLACDLRIDVKHYTGQVDAVCFMRDSTWVEAEIGITGDRAAAARLAVTQVASELGRASHDQLA